MEDNIDADYMHAKRVWKYFELKKLGEYHDLYVKSHTLLLADLFHKFWNMCLEIYRLDSAHSLSAPRIVWQASFGKNKVKFDLLTDFNMLLIEEKVLEVKYSMLFTHMQNLITNT